MSNLEKEFLEIVKSSIEYKLECLNWKKEDVGFFLEGIIFSFASPSEEFLNEMYSLRNDYLGLED